MFAGRVARRLPTRIRARPSEHRRALAACEPGLISVNPLPRRPHYVPGWEDRWSIRRVTEETEGLMDTPQGSLDIAALQRSLQQTWPRHPVTLIETHISWVLLCGKLAYKLKKPVSLGFLDFRTAEARQRACEEELRLNRRTAPALYIDVVPVCGTLREPHLRGAGPVIDHAVRMRRFPDGALFSERLAAGELSAAQVERLARSIAQFHLAAPVADAASAYGTPQAIEAATSAVVASLASKGDPADLAPVRRWLDAQAALLRPVWTERRACGRVREGHGDLHLANAAVLDGEVVPFDCIEFDPALRWIDVMDDVAFMMMDLLAHERRDLAFRFLDAWLESTGDHRGLTVLPYDIVVRALVRALVARLRPPPARGQADETPDYLALARRLTDAPADARLLITCGLAGSGKSWVTQRLLEHIGAVRLRSDVERKRLHGLAPLQRSASFVPEGIYGEDTTRRTYDTLLERATWALRAGWPTLVDATFLRLAERERFARLAADLDVPFAVLHCHAPAATLRERIRARADGQHDASEADEAVLAQQQQARDPLTDEERRRTVDVDTAQPLDVGRVAHCLREAARVAA
jgi:aminoglycoside phosphotransferase family enzyme/predicted kinase